MKETLKRTVGGGKGDVLSCEEINCGFWRNAYAAIKHLCHSKNRFDVLVFAVHSRLYVLLLCIVYLCEEL